MKHTILCVDDEVDNVDALERLLRNKYRVLKAVSGDAALKILDQNRVTVIISDQRMPQMTGVEFLSKSLGTHPNAIRVLLTGYADIEVVIEAINSGHIYRYVTKPWDPVDLVNTIDKAVERYELGEALVETNKKLSEALVELQTLDQAKNQFMVLVNHELKTPLTTMLSFSDLLTETKLDVDQERYLSRIRTAAHRLQEMINDSLELVSAETQQTKLNLTRLKTKDLFATAALPEAIHKLLSEKHLEMKLDIDNQDVVADERLIRNVYRRLLHNAAKFADANTEIRIKGQSNGGLYRLSITDTGRALDESKIKSLLKPFTLNENTLNHSVGTGLGLSISHALLKLHSAGLEFNTTGNTVTVSFQLGRDPDKIEQ